MKRLVTAEDALGFVEEHGVVLAAAKGPVPRLTEAIAGEPIMGSWWAHPQGRRIYAILAAVTESEQVLACRLVNRKITLVHRRLWPSLVRLATHFEPQQLARLSEEHMPSGHHISHAIPFPRWVPAEVLKQARDVSEQDALDVFGSWRPPSRLRPGKPSRNS